MDKLSKMSGNPSSRLTAAKGVLRDIASYSSVHGVRYVAEGSFASRIIWSFAIVTSAAGMVGFAGVLWRQYLSGSSEVALLSTREPTYKLPFPAVSICPEPPFEEHAARDALKQLLNLSNPLSELHTKAADSVTEVLSNSWPHKWRYMGLTLQSLRDLLGMQVTLLDHLNLQSIMLKAFPKCSEWLVRCQWHSTVVPCCSGMFQFQQRLDRWCYVFNSLSEDKMRSECDEAEENVTCKLRKTGMPGDGSGVFVVFNQSGSIQTGRLSKLWISTSSPFSLPAPTSDTLINASPGDGVRVKVSAATTMASADFVTIPERTRKCRFKPRDNSLSSPRYSALHCVANLYHDETQKICGCVPATLLHLTERRRTALPCNLTSMVCVQKMGGIEDAVGNRCLNPCEQDTYIHMVKKGPAINHGVICDDCFQVSIFHADCARGITYERRRTVNQFTIIYKTSGLLGLLLGCSMLIFVENAYYAIRIFGALVFGMNTSKPSIS